MFNASPGAQTLADMVAWYEASGRSLPQLARILTVSSEYRASNPVDQTAREFADKLLSTWDLQGNADARDFVTAKFNAGVPKGQIAYDVAAAVLAATDAKFANAKALMANKVNAASFQSVTLGLPGSGTLSGITTDAASVTAANKALAQKELATQIVGLLDASPGAAVLSELTTGLLGSGQTLAQFMAGLATNPLFLAQYPASLSADAFATTFLTPLGLQGNAVAREYVVSRVNAGDNRAQVLSDAIGLVRTLSSPDLAQAKALLENKTEVALFHATVIGGNPANVDAAHAVLSKVTADVASVQPAKDALSMPPAPAPDPSPTPPPPPPPAPQSFTLTAGTDSFSGGGLGDTFTGTLGAGATYQPASDTLDGGGGNDTLVLSSSSGTPLYSINGTKVTQIEKLQYTATNGSPTSVDLSGTSFNELVNSGSTTGVTFSGFGAGVTRLGIANVSGQTSTFNPDGAALTGNADALTLTLNAVTGGAIVRVSASVAAANEYETLNIVSEGSANSITLGTNTTQTSLSAIHISGAAALALAFTSASDHVTTSATTIDAHAATGGVRIGSYSAPLGVANHTITLGTGDNVVFIDGNSLNASDTLDATLGGNDVLAISNNPVTAAALAQVTGVETMRFQNQSGTLIQDVTQLPAGVKLQVDGVDSVISFTNLANNAAVDVLGAFRLNMALLNDAGASDALTVRLAPATTAGAALTTLANVTGMETLNLVSNAASGQTVANTITSNQVTAAQVLTGSADLAITNAIKTTSFDAQAFTGKLTITGQASQATTIKGGSGNDTITLGTGGDTVDAGAGDDTIFTAALITSTHVGRGSDTITTGVGNDTIVFADNLGSGNGGANSYAGVAGIADFKVGASAADSDFLAFSGADASFRLLTATGLAKGSVAQGLAAGNAMVVQDVGLSGGAAVALGDVSFIKLTTAVAFNTNIMTTFANALGTGSVTGLAADGNYLVSLYDTTAQKAVIAVVNVGRSGAGDTVLSTADFLATGIAVVGVMDMLVGDYASFGAAHLAAAL
jgi:hypothetical protein